MYKYLKPNLSSKLMLKTLQWNSTSIPIKNPKNYTSENNHLHGLGVSPSH